MASKQSTVRRAAKLGEMNLQALFDKARETENDERQKKGKPLLKRIRASFRRIPDWVVSFARQVIGTCARILRRPQSYARCSIALKLH